MDPQCKRKQSFLLRLPLSVREQAEQIARNDGTSLNHFISLALAEKISRMEQASSIKDDMRSHTQAAKTQIVTPIYQSRLPRAS